MAVRKIKSLSVKTRVALGMTLLFTLAIVFITALQLRVQRQSMTDVLKAQQTSLVTRVADEIDSKFRTRQAALSAVAAHLGPALAGGPEAAQAALLLREALPAMFDQVLLFSIDGQVVASAPHKPELARLNVAQRPYFADTMVRGRPVISAPYRSLADGKPFVMMTAPVFDAQGRMVGMLGGAIGLLEANFLGNIGAASVGATGHFFVATRGALPTVVSHRDKSRIMTPVAVPATAARISTGFEGTVEGTNSGGTALLSYKRLHETDWVLGAALPAGEAFGPLQLAQERLVFTAVLLAALLGLITWGQAYWLLLPLGALREYVHARRQGAEVVAVLPVRRWDEIGVLTHEFNTLMAGQEATRQALTDNEARLRTITDNLPVLIGYVDRELRYRFNNQVYEEWFGVDRDALYGKTLLEVLGPEEYAVIRPDVDEALRGYVVCREREMTMGGRTRMVSSTFMPDYGPDHQVRGYYVLTHDITAEKAAQARLAFLAQHDTLTELPNRACLNERMALALRRAARSGKPLALMYLDIDKFKSINDTHGHGAGDLLLKAFAGRLLAQVRVTDLVARLGGDEFVVLLEDLGAAGDAALVAGKIVAAMREPFMLEGLELRATTSVGVALHAARDDSIGGAELLAQADAALYQAKQGGRDGYRMAQAAPVLSLVTSTQPASALVAPQAGLDHAA